jgi:DedD protein
LAGYSWSQFTGMAPLPSALPKIESAGTDARNVAVGRTTDATSVPSAPAASAPRETAPAPAAVASAALPAASPPAPATSDTWTPPTVALPPLARPAASAPVANPAVTNPAKAPAKQPAPAQSTATPAAPATPTAAAPPARRGTARPATPSVTVETLPATVPQDNTPRALRFSVNVGSFTDENQALNAYVALTDARLPATRQTFVDRNGPRVVVRVGPYDTPTEAEAAAETVRGLGLAAPLPPR